LHRQSQSCVILVPVRTSIELGCELALRELEARGYEVRRIHGYAAIDQCRNEATTDALGDGFEEVFWIDADIGFGPEDVDRIRAHDLPVVAGIYAKKGSREVACHVLPGTQALQFGNAGGLVEILYAGTGFLHVRSAVFDQIQRKLELPVCNLKFGRAVIPWFLPMIIGGSANLKPNAADLKGNDSWYLAEDFAFCHRARAAGFKIMADTAARLWHIGNYNFGWEDAGRDVRRFESFTLNLQ